MFAEIALGGAVIFFGSVMIVHAARVVMIAGATAYAVLFR